MSIDQYVNMDPCLESCVILHSCLDIHDIRQLMVTMLAMVTGCQDTYPCLDTRQLMATIVAMVTGCQGTYPCLDTRQLMATIVAMVTGCQGTYPCLDTRQLMATMVAMVTGCYGTYPCLDTRQLMATIATINKTPPIAKQIITTENIKQSSYCHQRLHVHGREKCLSCFGSIHPSVCLGFAAMHSILTLRSLANDFFLTHLHGLE